jgi:hypothetical protein
VVTTGDASVSPYPSAMTTPKRRCMDAAVSSGSREAPEVAKRTLLKASGGASRIVAQAVHIGGAPATTVTP